MSVRWIEGFDQYSSITDMTKAYRTAVMGESLFDVGRDEINSSLNYVGVVNNVSEFSTQSLGDNTTWVIGFAFKHRITNQFEILELRDNSNLCQVSLWIDPGVQHFKIYRGPGSTILGVGNRTIFSDTWYYVELKVVVDGSAGSAELHVNELVDMKLTNINTKASITPSADRVAFVHPSGYYLRYFLDDMYILDGSGTSNNDFLGDMRVELLRTRGVGAATQWSPSANIDNYLAAQNIDTNYVRTSTLGNEDLYLFDQLSLINGSVAAVSVNVFAKNSDVVARGIRGVVKSGSIQQDSADALLSERSFVATQFIYETDPNTHTTWSIDGVNSAQYGIKLSYGFSGHHSMSGDMQIVDHFTTP